MSTEVQNLRRRDEMHVALERGDTQLQIRVTVDYCCDTSTEAWKEGVFIVRPPEMGPVNALCIVFQPQKGPAGNEPLDYIVVKHCPFCGAPIVVEGRVMPDFSLTGQQN